MGSVSNSDISDDDNSGGDDGGDKDNDDRTVRRFKLCTEILFVGESNMEALERVSELIIGLRVILRWFCYPKLRLVERFG